MCRAIIRRCDLHPKVGETNARAGGRGVCGRGDDLVQVEGDPRNHYIARMDWADN